MDKPIKLPPPAVEDYDMELWGQNVRVDLYTAKQVLTAVEQNTAALHAERDALRAELLNIADIGKRHEIAKCDGLAEWADWAQNRARHAALKEVKP